MPKRSPNPPHAVILAIEGGWWDGRWCPDLRQVTSDVKMVELKGRINYFVLSIPRCFGRRPTRRRLATIANGGEYAVSLVEMVGASATPCRREELQKGRPATVMGFARFDARRRRDRSRRTVQGTGEKAAAQSNRAASPRWAGRSVEPPRFSTPGSAAIDSSVHTIFMSLLQRKSVGSVSLRRGRLLLLLRRRGGS